MADEERLSQKPQVVGMDAIYANQIFPFSMANSWSPPATAEGPEFSFWIPPLVAGPERRPIGSFGTTSGHPKRMAVRVSPWADRDDHNPEVDESENGHAAPRGATTATVPASARPAKAGQPQDRRMPVLFRLVG